MRKNLYELLGVAVVSCSSVIATTQYVWVARVRSGARSLSCGFLTYMDVRRELTRRHAGAGSGEWR